MRQDWEPEDLIEVWTLLEDDMKRLRNKSGANRLGFAMLLKFFEAEARFPETDREVPAAAVGYVAQQVKVPADQWAAYDWQGDRITRHRKEIRKAFGFRAGTEEDQERLAEWLTAELCGVELSRDRLAEAVVARCRNDFVEPPACPASARAPDRSRSARGAADGRGQHGHTGALPGQVGAPGRAAGRAAGGARRAAAGRARLDRPGPATGCRRPPGKPDVRPAGGRGRGRPAPGGTHRADQAGRPAPRGPGRARRRPGRGKVAPVGLDRDGPAAGPTGVECPDPLGPGRPGGPLRLGRQGQRGQHRDRPQRPSAAHPVLLVPPPVGGVGAVLALPGMAEALHHLGRVTLQGGTGTTVTRPVSAGAWRPSWPSASRATSTWTTLWRTVSCRKASTTR